MLEIAVKAADSKRAVDIVALNVSQVSLLVRLKRMGSKKHPVYRIVVADSRSPRDGRFY
jgi:hypothetical protein